MKKLTSILSKVVVAIALVIVIALVAVPYMVGPFFGPHQDRTSHNRNTCIMYLKQIDSAKEQWAMDNHKLDGAVVTMNELCGETLYLKRAPECPNGGEYSVNPVGKNPTCSHPGDDLPN